MKINVNSKWKIALYNEDPVEQIQLRQYLESCVDEIGGVNEIIIFQNHVELYDAFHEHKAEYDLIVIANNGTFSLEAIELIKKQINDTRRIIWFSDLDFSLRSYKYGVAWFSIKPVSLELMKKAFSRVIEYHEKRM